MIRNIGRLAGTLCLKALTYRCKVDVFSFGWMFLPTLPVSGRTLPVTAGIRREVFDCPKQAVTSDWLCNDSSLI